MRKETVRPRIVNGKPLVVKDRLGRTIECKKEGVEMPFSTTLSRLCKEGDLLIKKGKEFVDINKWKKDQREKEVKRLAAEEKKNEENKNGVKGGSR